MGSAVGRFVFASNLPFCAVEHPEFRNVMKVLRPSAAPVSARNIRNKQLPATYAKERAMLAAELQGQEVTPSLDGWSTAQSVLVIGIAVQDSLVSAIETLGEAHTSEFLLKVCEEAIENIQTELGVKVVAVVTDSAANMLLMRQNLESRREGVT